MGTTVSTTTDERGAFTLQGVPIGDQNLELRLQGQLEVVRAEVTVRAARVAVVNVELSPSLWRQHEQLVVSSAEASERIHGDSHVLAAPELRRTSPGDDLGRALYVLPGVVQVDDSANDLVVRGGSPTENGYYVDNIPVPNINHFPQDGASGGSLSMLNLDFVDDVKVLTGGFGAAYGEHLSSVVDIRWREGDRSAVKGRLDLNLLGAGGGIEGPIPGGKGSWMVSGRYGYMDVLAGALNLGSIDLGFSDVQGKLVYDLSPSHRLSFVDIFGRSSGTRDEAKAVQSGEAQGWDDIRENTAGLNWRALWGRRGFSLASLSYAFLDNTGSWQAADGSGPVWRRDSHDGALTLRNLNHIQLTGRQRLELGFEARSRSARAFDVPSQQQVHLSRLEGALFASYAYSGRLSGSLGARLEREPFNGRLHVLPRLSASFAASSRLTFSTALGVYRQSLPFALLKQAPENRELASPTASHVVLGAAYRLGKDTRITLEAYDKEYRHFPMSPEIETRFVFDDVSGNEKSFWNYDSLVDSGRAYARGVELMVHKSLTKKIYGVASGSLFRTRYRDLQGAWRNRLHDNRYVVNVTGGFRTEDHWDLSARFLLAGGKGTTPWITWNDSTGRVGMLDWDHWMTTHLPQTHTLGLRAARRVEFRRASLGLYVAAWNVYGRKNVRYYYWDGVCRKLKTAYQWGTVPFVGVELVF